MRIATHTRNYRSGLSKEQKDVNDLKKSDIISDIFNHQPVDDSKEKKNSRLHLSNASKALARDLKAKIQEFLKKNKELSTHLHKVELPDEFESELRGDLSARKLRTYLKWRELYGDDPSSMEGNLIHFKKIQSFGKDEEVKKIYEENEEKRELIKQNRNKHQPSYYYMVFPETYSFN